MERSQKLETVGRLAGSIAHDFNNLLTVILSSAELAVAADAEQSRQLLSEITTAGQSAARLTAQLVSLSGQRKAPPQVLDVGDVVQDLSHVIARLANDRVDLQLNIAEGCLVRMDPSHLDQIVMNLAVNALDASPEGGQLRLSVAVHPPGRVALRVTDTGVGIDPEALSHIFEPLYTTKAEGRGSGIGLAVVQRVVLEAGGVIEVDTTVGEGTCFTVLLPATQSIEITKASRGIDNACVLLVDDDDAVRRAAARTLERGGYRVISCEGMDSVQEVMAQRLHVDVVVCDVVLQGCMGPEVVGYIQRIDPHLPVIYISGHTAGILRSYGVPTDVPIVGKPFGPSQLVAAVAKALQPGT